MPQLYSRVFVQILDSSLAEDYVARHVFEDFLKLAEDGLVDMTREAIARRTNIPLDVVNTAIAKLEGPDPASRDPDEEGKRIIRLDGHRDWGWRIVNWHKYENIKSKEHQRAKTRERVARYRKKQSPPPTPPPQSPDPYSDSDSDSEGALQKRYTPLQGALQNVTVAESTTSETVVNTCQQSSTKADKDSYKHRRIPATEEEAVAMGNMRACPEEWAKAFYNHYQAVGWIDANGHPIMDGGAKLNAWIAEQRQRQHQARSGGSSAPATRTVYTGPAKNGF